MFGLMLKSTHVAAMKRAAIDVATAETARDKALGDLVRMATDRDNVRDSRDMAYRRCTHLEAEVAKLERDIAGLVPDAEAHRARRAKQTLNLRQFRKGHLGGSAGIAANGSEARV